MAPEYILRCQKDSHLRSLGGVEVVACESVSEAELDELLGKVEKKPKGNKGKKGQPGGAALEEPSPTHRVQLAETVLFPEGGGQPFDTGRLEIVGGSQHVNVLRVHRLEDGSTWHFTDGALSAGAQVDVHVDWARRFDHMQCHSGQHLITAVAQKYLGAPTLGWSLTAGAEPCYLDLEVEEVPSREQLDLLEQRTNEEIRANRSMTATAYSPDEFRSLNDVRFKALPDSRFPVRVVEIEGLDVNACCGTHVRGTAELQLAKILRAERAKEGVSRVYFVVGNRALLQFSALSAVARDLTDRLACAPGDFADRVDVLARQNKANAKAVKSLQADLAAALAPALISGAELVGGRRLVVYHRRDVGPEFVDLFLKAVDVCEDQPPEPLVLLLSTGDETAKGGGAGTLVLRGAKEDEAFLKPFSAAVLESIGARGGGRGNKIQGKIPEGALTAKALAGMQELARDLLSAAGN